MSAAKWALVPITNFDRLDVLAQAEIVAGFLVDSRIREIADWEQREEIRLANTQGGHDED